MKPAIQISIPLFIAILLTPSCKKDSHLPAPTIASQPPSIPISNSLAGKEFYLDATWSLWTDLSGDEIYVSIDPSQFFSMATLATQTSEVSIRLDSSADWIVVPFWNWYPCCTPPPTANDYCWYFARYPYAQSVSFIIENSPLNYQLKGEVVKVKVKF